MEASADDVERVEGRDGGEAGGRSGGGVLPGPRLPGRRRGSRRHLRREVVASLWGLAAARIFLGTLALTTTRELSLLGWAGLGLLPMCEKLGPDESPTTGASSHGRLRLAAAARVLRRERELIFL